MEGMAEELLKIGDVVSICKLCERHIDSLVGRGEFPKPIKIGRSKRWARRQIDAWIHARVSAAAGSDKVAWPQRRRTGRPRAGVRNERRRGGTVRLARGKRSK